MTRKESGRKQLRQTTLLEQLSSSPQRPLPSTSKTQPPRNKRVIVDSDSDSSSSESHIGVIPFESEDADSTVDAPAPQSSPRRKRVMRVSSESSSEVSDVQERVTSNVNSKGRNHEGERIKRRRLDESNESEDAVSEDTSSRPSISDNVKDEDATPSKKILKRRLVRKQSNSPQEVVSEEEDIKNEVDEQHIISARFRERGKKSIFQKNLERLKQRKSGLPKNSNSGSEDWDGEDAPPKPFRSAKPTIEFSDSDEVDEKDEDGDDFERFIVEDDGTTEQVELPVEFSMGTHQDLGYHFKTIFQFFVHIAVQEPGKREEFMQEAIRNSQYFSVPLQIARRKISGLRDSLVASSVWKPEFKNPLMKYPEFELMMLDFALPGCSACNLGGRLSSRVAYLGGKPYNKNGFEPIEDEEDEEGEENDRDIPSTGAKAEFHLGRFCARRCHVFHTMCHWEYTLYRVILHEIECLQALRDSRGFVKVSHAHGKRPPKDLKDADKLVEWLDDRQIIEREWGNIRKLMNSAHELEFASKKGEMD